MELDLDMKTPRSRERRELRAVMAALVGLLIQTVRIRDDERVEIVVDKMCGARSRGGCEGRKISSSREHGAQ